MNNMYLAEAFKRLSLLEDDFYVADQGKVDELKAFMEDDIELPEEEIIIDPEALKPEDLQDTYVGKVIIECDCCHSRVYKDADQIVVNEESGLANEEEECPVCGCEAGYHIIGKIESFDKEKDVEKEAENIEDGEEPEELENEEDKDEEAEDEEELEDEEIEEALAEALGEGCKEVNDCAEKDKEELEHSNISEGCEHHCEDGECEHEEHDHDDDHDEKEDVDESYGNKDEEDEEEKLDPEVDESCHKVEEELLDHGNENLEADQELACDDTKSLEDNQEELVHDGKENIKPITEAIENVEVKSEDGNIEVGKEGNKVTVEFKNEENIDANVEDDLGLDAAGEDAEVPAEEIVPLNDEEQNEILNNEEPALEDEFGEDEFGEEDEFNVDEFDDDFDKMGESYLRRVYENVKSYNVTDVKQNKDKQLVVEGLITFDSGKTRATTFVFENRKVTKRGKNLLEGKNEMFSKSNKAFMLKGTLENHKFVCESLTYSYSAQTLNEANGNETLRIYGRVTK